MEKGGNEVDPMRPPANAHSQSAFVVKLLHTPYHVATFHAKALIPEDHPALRHIDGATPAR